MAKTDNLGDFLTDIANSIRTKTGTTELINAQDFSDKILSIQTGGGENTLKKLLAATKKANYLFYEYQGTSVDGLIQYNDTENVEEISRTFYRSKVVKVPELNTSKAKDFSYTFAYSSINEFPNWNFSNAENIKYLLSDCKSLKTDIVINNLSKLSDDYCLTGLCQQNAVRSVTLNDLNPNMVYSLDQAFFDCGWLQNVSLNTTTGVPMKVKSMLQTFNYCSQLETLPLP